MTRWRLIPPIAADGAFQMALDSWLFEQLTQGTHPPTLRFYTWHPIALSLGYHQRHYPDHWRTLTWQGNPVDLVRRPTGGRAVLHQGDLTYAVVNSGVSAHRQQAYRDTCEFLIQGGRSLGIDLAYGTAGRGYIQNPNCFGTATGADLVLPNGRKLIGSAQLRRGDALLQHGSLQLNPDPALFAQVFGSVPPVDPSFSVEPAYLQQVMDALIAAAQTCFAADFDMQPLTDAEWARIRDRRSQWLVAN